MIPVELELTNFLSYGTHAPVLNFDTFHVACLSGGNGQGKSALLDAITWALWGEARKSSGNRKPDADLLRIGARHMQVDFVFDVEGSRYRVSRAYTETATGRTTKPGLEIQAFDPEAGQYRPLTTGTMRDTQEQITSVVGLDYETFINSSFLLQGRSDEFTKKRPSERKEILTRVLGLDRYKALAAIAGERSRDAKAKQEHLRHEVDRLRSALEDVPAWKASRDAHERAAAEHKKALDALRTEEKKLTEARAALHAQAQEAEAAEASLAALANRMTGYNEEAAELERKIQKAEALLEKSEAIEKNLERYGALQKERDALDNQRDRFSQLKDEIGQAEAALQQKKSDVAQRLHALDVQRRTDEAALSECKERLAQKPEVEKALAAAQKAKERAQAMSQRRKEREAIKARQSEAEQALGRAEEQRRARLDELQKRMAELKDALGSTDALQKRRTELAAAEEKLSDLKKRKEETLEKGQRLKQKIEKRRGHLSAREEELGKQQKQLARLRETEGGACPTCGVALSDDHRAEVEADFRQAIAALEEALAEGRGWMDAQEARREALRSTYQALEQDIAARADVPGHLARTEEKLRALEAQREALGKAEKEAQALCTALREKTFAQDARQRVEACAEKLEALPFDEEAYERLQHEAAQVGACQDRLAALEEAATRKEKLEKAVATAGEEIEALQKAQAGGSAYGELPQKLEALREKLSALGFDAERLRAVRQSLRELEDAPVRMRELHHARRNQSDWKAQRERVRQRLSGAEEEEVALQEKRAALREALKGKADLEEKARANAEARRTAEGQLHAVQQEIGRLSGRLAQARTDRAALKKQRTALAEAKKARGLYKHLRTAFGKNGIPSLIIEQTLPEIEDRTNALLESLTDGRMHVRLETLADKKSGGTKETLDIIITDEQGQPRPYETFSGGEAFRVNFALRIALAQLLAERSGVRIRTLVIDEGFGTQDPEGVQSLVEAIRTIQDDFDKIIVITHLEELKQVFPVRIEVEKDPATGSSFELTGV